MGEPLSRDQKGVSRCRFLCGFRGCTTRSQSRKKQALETDVLEVFWVFFWFWKGCLELWVGASPTVRRINHDENLINILDRVSIDSR